MIELAALAARFALLPACSASDMTSGVACAEGPAGAVGKMLPCAVGEAGAASSLANRTIAAMMVIREIAIAPSQKNRFRSKVNAPLHCIRDYTLLVEPKYIILIVAMPLKLSTT
jgi:hypothetical protein